MSQDMNKSDQKERWKFVLEKFSHASMAVGKRNIAHLGVEPQLLEMPECKRGKFVGDTSEKTKAAKASKAKVDENVHENSASSGAINNTDNLFPMIVEEDSTFLTCVSVSTTFMHSH